MDPAGTTQVCPHSTYQPQKTSQQTEVSGMRGNSYYKKQRQAELGMQSITGGRHHSDGRQRSFDFHWHAFQYS